MLFKIGTIFFVLLGLFIVIFFAYDSLNKNSAVGKFSSGLENLSRNLLGSADSEKKGKTFEAGSLRKLDNKTEKLPAKTTKQPYKNSSVKPYKLSEENKIYFSDDNHVVIDIQFPIDIQSKMKLTADDKDNIKAKVVRFLKDFLNKPGKESKIIIFGTSANYDKWLSSGKFIYIDLYSNDRIKDERLETYLPD